MIDEKLFRNSISLEINKIIIQVEKLKKILS